MLLKRLLAPIGACGREIYSGGGGDGGGGGVDGVG